MSTSTSHRAPSAPSSSAKPSSSTTIRRSKWSDVQPTAYEAAGGSSRDSVMAEWVYKDAKGEEVFRLIGLEAPGGRRRCRAAHLVPEGWEAGEGDGPLPLYRLDQLPAKGVVFVCCSEEDADVAGVSMDLPAVTSAFGHGVARRSDWSPLAGRCVAILPENNERGRAYAAEVAQVLLELEPKAKVKVLELPGLPPGGNVFWFQDQRCLTPKTLPTQVGVEVRELANQAPMYKPPVWDADAAAGAPGAAAAIGQPVLTRFSEVEAEEVQWLWPGRVALGKLTLLYGDPNLGKSLLTLDMAARVTTGAAWPDGRGTAPLGSVVLATAEDGKKDTVPARLARAGADAAKVLSLDEILETRPSGAGGVAGVNGGGEVRRPFTLEDWRELERALEREPDVRLVVIDPVSAFLGERGGSSNAANRALLAPIAMVAERRRVAVVMVTHITKDGGSHALYRAVGSLAFIAAARAAWLAVEDPKDAGRRLLLPVKNNLADDQGGLAYRTAGGAVAWDAEPVKTRADAALAAGRRRRKPGPAPVLQRAAGAWLRAQLAAGPAPVGGTKNPAPGTLRARAREWKWSWAVIDRVSRKIGVVKEYCPEGRQFLWRLPPGEAPGEAPGETPGEVPGEVLQAHRDHGHPPV